MNNDYVIQIKMKHRRRIAIYVDVRVTITMTHTFRFENTRPNPTDAELIADMQRVSAKHTTSHLSQRDYCRIGRYSSEGLHDHLVEGWEENYWSLLKKYFH